MKDYFQFQSSVCLYFLILLPRFCPMNLVHIFSQGCAYIYFTEAEVFLGTVGDLVPLVESFQCNERFSRNSEMGRNMSIEYLEIG